MLEGEGRHEFETGVFWMFALEGGLPSIALVIWDLFFVETKIFVGGLMNELNGLAIEYALSLQFVELFWIESGFIIHGLDLFGEFQSWI